MKIGTVLCTCGNSLKNIDWEELRGFIESKNNDGICIVHNNACSKQGKDELKEILMKERPDRIVFGGCTPKTAGYLFEDMLKEVGISPFQIIGANLREHVSWVTDDRVKGTQKAKALVLGAYEKAKHDISVEQYRIPISRNVVVIGAGPAGLQITQDLATAGLEVNLVDRNPFMGGYTVRTGFYYPTDDCSACLSTEGIKGMHQPNIRRCQYRSAFDQNPNINLLMNSEIMDVTGSPGNYNVKIKQKPTYVRLDRCTLCNECVVACPVEKPDEFNLGLTTRKAIYLPSITTSTTKYVLNRDECPEGCTECEKTCPVGAIDLQQQESIINIRAGAIVVATGFKEYDPRLVSEYGYGREGFENVLTQTELARFLDITGPTHGLLTKKNGDPVKRLVIINCVGSRSPKHNLWCSNICCMIALKHAINVKEAQPDIDVTICYIDIRAVGPDYENYYNRARDLGVMFVRGRPSNIESDGNELHVNVEDSSTGTFLTLRADTVALSMSMVPNDGAVELAEKLDINIGESGYFESLYSKFRPIETKQAGVFVAGASISPSDIPTAVTLASAAAAKVSTLLQRETVVKRFPIAEVNEDLCYHCGLCVSSCPYGAIEAVEVPNPGMKVVVNKETCMGCGLCVTTCPVSAISIPYYSEDQIMSQVRGTLYDAKDVQEPIIAAFTCWECGYSSTDYVGQMAVSKPEMKYPANVRIIPVQCTGNISIKMLQETFDHGADGILIIGCYEDRCHYDSGSKASSIRVNLFKSMLEQAGIDPRRLERENLFTSCADKFVEITKRMNETLSEIGKLERI
ncbi:MAG: hydrogenase iron-sulfur subunit [Candidatus Hodarchaeales archaeon]